MIVKIYNVLIIKGVIITLYSKEEYYNRCRIKAAGYLSEALSMSNVNEEIKSIVGKSMVLLYGKIYYEDGISNKGNMFCELDANFLDALDSISIYILKVKSIEELEDVEDIEDPIAYISNIRNKTIRELVLELYDICENELK